MHLPHEPNTPNFKGLYVAYLQAPYHRRGSCYARPGRGTSSGYTSMPVPRTFPAGESSTAFSPEVLTSTPNGSLEPRCFT